MIRLDINAVEVDLFKYYINTNFINNLNIFIFK